jgi:hypothetical protein
MRPTSIAVRMHAHIVAAGPAGISAQDLCTALVCSTAVLNQSRVKARNGGLQFWTLFRSIAAGGMYYATEAWRDAGAAQWQAQVDAAAKRRQDVYRARKSGVSVEERKARRAEQKRAQRQRAREREKLAKPEAAAAAKAKPKTPKPAKAAPLHDIGAHMRSVARDGRMVTKHQATFDRQRQGAIKATPAPVVVDYSRAKVTVCPSGRDTRFTVEGPVFSVLNPNDCRAWAKAATA